MRPFRPVVLSCEIANSHFAREDWFAVREIARLEHGELFLSLFDVFFQQRFLLHEFIMTSSRSADATAVRTSCLGEADRCLVGLPVRCGNATLRTRARESVRGVQTGCSPASDRSAPGRFSGDSLSGIKRHQADVPGPRGVQRSLCCSPRESVDLVCDSDRNALVRARERLPGETASDISCSTLPSTPLDLCVAGGLNVSVRPLRRDQRSTAPRTSAFAC